MRLPAPRRYIARPMKYSPAHWHLLRPVGLLAILILGGCTAPNAGNDGDIDLLTEPSLTINKDTNEFYVGIVVTLDEGATLDTLWAEMYLASGLLADSIGSTVLQASVALKDDATGGDILSADGIYAGTFVSPLPPGTGGSVQFDIMDQLSGELTTLTDTLALQNLRPVILSVTAGDTLIVPPDGSTFFTLDTIRVEVSDPDGLADIKQVSFTSVKLDSTLANPGNPISLADNGDLTNWGDATEDDGIYSIIIEIVGSTIVGTYTYRFVATDLSFNKSDTTFRTVVLTR